MVRPIKEKRGLQKIKEKIIDFKPISFIAVFALLIGATLYMLSKPQDIRQRAAEAPPILDPHLSVSHVSGIYPSIGSDYLIAGAKDALSLGFQNIEIYLSPAICWTNRPAVKYGIYQTLDWCNNTDPYAEQISTKAQSLKELAQDARYQQLFDLPFKTFLITTDVVNQKAGASFLRVSLSPYSQSELTTSYIDFYNLSTYLLTKYKDSGKTFILQTPNEMDWSMVGGFNPSLTPNDTTISNATLFWNVIQNAVNDAKKYVPEVGMHLYQGCEFNLVKKAMRGGVAAINAVVPKTYCDLYGYSAYDTVLSNISSTTEAAIPLSQALNYIASKAPPSKDFGHKNIYISELGIAERNYPGVDTAAFMTRYAEEAITWGVPYVNLWTLYDNDCPSYLPTTDTTCPGYWMRKPTNELSNTYLALKNRFNLLAPTSTPIPTLTLTPTPTVAPTNAPTPTLVPTRISTPTPTPTKTPTSTFTPNQGPTPTTASTPSTTSSLTVTTSPVLNAAIKIVNRQTGQIALSGITSITNKILSAGDYYVTFSYSSNRYKTPRITYFTQYAGKSTTIVGNFIYGTVSVTYR